MLRKNEHTPFFKNVFWQSGLQVAKYVFPFLTFPYVTRILGPDYYAVYAYVVSVMTFVQVIVDFGFNLSGTKRVAKDRDNPKALGLLVGAITEARLILIIIVFGGILVLSQGIDLLKDNQAYVIAVYFALALRGLLPDFIFQGLEYMRPLTTRFCVCRGLYTVLIFALVRGPESMILIPLIDIATSGLSVIWSFAVMNRRFNVKIRWAPLSEGLSNLKESALYCVSNISSVALTGLMTLSMGILSFDASDIAYWSVAMSALSAIQALYSPVMSSLYPHMVNSFSQSFVKKIALLALPFILVGTAAFALLSKQIMLVLGGESYLPGAYVVQIVSFIILFSFYSALFGWPVLGATGRVAEVTASTCIAAIACALCVAVMFGLNISSLVWFAVMRCGVEFVLFITRLLFYVKAVRKDNFTVGV